jgi:hypothetical protein
MVVNVNLTELWLRIISNIGSGIGSLLLALTGAGFLGRRDIGHRLLITFGVIFFGERSITSFIVAWNIYHGHSRSSLFLHVATAIVGFAFGCVVWASRNDALTTLITTEAADRRRKDIARDAEQARLNFAYISDQTLLQSSALRAEQSGVLSRWLHRGGLTH